MRRIKKSYPLLRNRFVLRTFYEAAHSEEPTVPQGECGNGPNLPMRKLRQEEAGRFEGHIVSGRAGL